MMRTERLRFYPASLEQMEAMIASEQDEELKKAYSEMLEGCLRHPDQWDDREDGRNACRGSLLQRAPGRTDNGGRYEWLPNGCCGRKEITMLFKGIGRTFSTENDQQYETIGAFRDEPAAKY